MSFFSLPPISNPTTSPAASVFTIPRIRLFLSTPTAAAPNQATSSLTEILQQPPPGLPPFAFAYGHSPHMTRRCILLKPARSRSSSAQNAPLAPTVPRVKGQALQMTQGPTRPGLDPSVLFSHHLVPPPSATRMPHPHDFALAVPSAEMLLFQRSAWLPLTSCSHCSHSQ